MPTSIPTPTLPATPTSVPTPSPSTSVLHVVVDGAAPVWQGPLLTGLFVLTAALITGGLALFSLWLSDRRKLKREDRRQWDNELKQGYVAILARTQEVTRSLALARSEGIDNLSDAVVAALELAREQQLLFELIAPQPVSQAVSELGDTLLEIYQKTFIAERQELPSLSWSIGLLAELNHRESQLRDKIRQALRTPRR